MLEMFFIISFVILIVFIDNVISSYTKSFSPLGEEWDFTKPVFKKNIDIEIK